MQAVIFAAGRGVRMMPLTIDTPKPMLRYRGRPILEWIMRSLPSDVDEIIIVIGYLGDRIRDYFGESFAGKPIRYVVEMNQRGSGGALLSARSHLHGRFFALNGDDLFQKDDLERLALVLRGMLVSRRKADRRVRTIEVSDDGLCVDLRQIADHEEDATIFTGAAVLDDSIFSVEFVSLASQPEELSFPDTLMEYAKAFPVQAVYTDFWKSISVPADLLG
jgi:UDP-N-acetylglucosamine diphosphorylase / glucose-1-phosphate thymidylyltransferase / UDP-N-acetylgalactosamine diphosphorylase / glucosamine-1-phosphate N-acetyltransferase / galactosamine-1-phosphate N-acetyltransferase